MTTNHKRLKGKAAAAATNAVRWLAVAAIRAYQVGIRPLNLWGCKFHPSCSHYALEAFEVHGPTRGFWLTLKRLLRCRPGTFGGVDPVPGREEFSQDTIPGNSTGRQTA